MTKDKTEADIIEPVTKDKTKAAILLVSGNILSGQGFPSDEKWKDLMVDVKRHKLESMVTSEFRGIAETLRR